MPFDQVQCTHLFLIELQPPSFDLFLILRDEWWFRCRVGYAHVFIGCQSASNVSPLVRLKKCRIQSRRLHHIGTKDAFDLVLHAHSCVPLILMRNTEDLRVTILGNLICPVTLALAYDQKKATVLTLLVHVPVADQSSGSNDEGWRLLIIFVLSSPIQDVRESCDCFAKSHHVAKQAT